MYLTMTDDQLREFRGHFPILREKTYLYNCSQGALSDAVENALAQYTNSWRTSLDPWREWAPAWEELRAEFAAFIHADPDEVALVNNASTGINPVANALTFADRPRVVMGEYEFPTMGHIWLAQQARGAQVEFLTGVNHSLPLDAYERAIDQRTAIVPITQVSFANGFRADIAAITKIAHERGALVMVDGYQDCGTRPLDVKALDIDFYVTGTLKYLLGPAGLGFLYVRRELIPSLTPSITSWMGQRDPFTYDTRTFDPSPTARRFDTGTPAVPNVFMARAALALLNSVGFPQIAQQVEHVTQAFLAGARTLRIATKTPADSVGPLVVLRANDAPSLVARMAERGIAVSARRDGVRFAFHAYNNMEDVGAALEALEGHLDLLVRE
jgi:selenocysteine lyase/cysteine desulfurase